MALRFLSAGESHGPQMTVIVDGLPAGLKVPPEALDQALALRQQGYGAGGRMAIEHDHARITAGVMAGQTTGGPVAIMVENRDHKNWKGDLAPLTTPRPGHADLVGAVKYGYRELRLALERASARETVSRVAAGTLARLLLAEFEIRIVGYVRAIGGIEAQIPSDPEAAFLAAEASDVRCPDPQAAEAMRAAIRQAKVERDTLGGVMEIVALGVPPGLGSYVQADLRLDARLAAAVMSIPAIKGVELGDGFANAALKGSQTHDPIELSGTRLTRPSNRAGGLEGGISNGQPIVVRAAMKPIATVLKAMPTVDLATGLPTATVYERSDFCAVPRAVPIVEAAVAWVLADALLQKLGGDSLAELRPRFAALGRLCLEDLPMDAAPWRFGFE